MPMPFRNSQVTATSSMVAPAPATPKSANQPSGVFGVSTMRAIFSVTDLKVCPGAMTRYSPVAGSIRRRSVFGFRSLVAIVASTLRRHAPPALLRVPDSDSTPRPHTSSADGYSDRQAPGSCAHPRCNFATRLSLSLMLPKVMAEAGHACWQAVTISPSRIGRFSLSASILAAEIRCTQ